MADTDNSGMEDSYYTRYCDLIWKNKYPMYVTIVMMSLLASNQISRYVIIATNVQMANDIRFGDIECRSIDRSIPRKHDVCRKNLTLCQYPPHVTSCRNHYTGTGMAYQLLSGPLFNIIFGFTGVPVGIMLERKKNNRKNVISACAMLWSVMLILGGFATSFWELAFTRLGVAMFEASFTAFAVSIISSYFSPNLRAMAMSIFMLGVHIGFSMAFIMKVFAVHAGWRLAYTVTGLPGIILGIVTYCTVREPSRELRQFTDNSGPTTAIMQTKPSNNQILSPAPFCNSLFAALLLGGAIRCGGGHTFYYNIQNYITHYYQDYPTEHFLSWIPVISGLCGSVAGGIIADSIATESSEGYTGRLKVILFSVLSTIPCALLVLTLPPPWCFIVLVPGYFLNEMWSGIIITAIVEQAPPGRQASAMAVYVMTLNVIGGNLSLSLPILRKMYSWRIAMLILWPGAYVCAAAMFAWSITLAGRRTIRTPVLNALENLQLGNGRAERIY
uniref:Probable sphingolipid transporter spinster homolog 1-like n=1 Tax=Saccoglossus kowalevskii TaxID=10224 RepID=A0ABM0GP82_SACKO|nr:PREDICTED: probable sphingolipid transporter spinster homolog 1-like [Saccoglossus kowalevskii]